MIDIVERLKATWAWSHGRLINPDGPEAANEIERLRKENEKLKIYIQERWKDAYSALKQKDTE